MIFFALSWTQSDITTSLGKSNNLKPLKEQAISLCFAVSNIQIGLAPGMKTEIKTT
jgi:hypothetical protein